MRGAMSRNIDRRARTPEERAEILDKLEGIWNRYPSLRLGQLLTICTSRNSRSLFYIEDKDLIDLLEKIDDKLGESSWYGN